MKKAVVIEAEDIKQILADKYNVPTKNVIKSQYSYTVILEDDEDDNIVWIIRKPFYENR